jgi:hypothetical protein
MTETILLGQGNQILKVTRSEWEGHLADVPGHMQTRLSFMSPAHHAVRYFAVRELPRRGEPLPPEFIAEALDLSLDLTQTILEDLEKNLFFLVRNEAGAVTWAFPVTAERTPHRLTSSTGERFYAA